MPCGTCIKEPWSCLSHAPHRRPGGRPQNLNPGPSPLRPHAQHIPTASQPKRGSMRICDRRSLTISARWLPKGFHTITPNIIVDDAEQAVAFFKNAFGAAESYRLTMANGKIAHCERKLGDSIFNLGTSMDGWPAHGLVAQIYVEDSDALFVRAVQAG